MGAHRALLGLAEREGLAEFRCDEVGNEPMARLVEVHVVEAPRVEDSSLARVRAR